MKTQLRTSAYLVRNTLNNYVNQKCFENTYRRNKTHVYVTLGFKP
jgi:hypothetical protein